MSHETVAQATEDYLLQKRVIAAAQKEAQNNSSLAATSIGEQLRANPGYAITLFMWSVAIDYETEYEYALNSNVENPGGDSAVITDGNITAAVVAHWPADA